MDHITYICKSCGWTKDIPATWSDISPRFCGNNSCELSIKKSKGKKSFKSEPDKLEKIVPAPKPKIELKTEKSPENRVRNRKRR